MAFGETATLRMLAQRREAESRDRVRKTHDRVPPQSNGLIATVTDALAALLVDRLVFGRRRRPKLSQY